MTLWRQGVTRESTNANNCSNGMEDCDGWTARNATGVAPNPSSITYALAAFGRDDEGYNSYYFTGALRDVRLYARALLGAELAALASVTDRR